MQPVLTVRSAKVVELAHRIAKAEGRSIASVVERALEAYASRHAEPADVFYQRLASYGVGDLEGPDLDELVEEDRTPYTGPDL